MNFASFEGELVAMEQFFEYNLGGNSPYKCETPALECKRFANQLASGRTLMAKDIVLPIPFEIQLTKGYVAIVDDCDADLADLKWAALETPSGCYAQRQIWNKGRTKCILMHRVILARMIGRELKRSDLCDHIHHNTLDNRRSELRLATHAQNTQNQRLMSNNTSGFRGVTFDKERQKWRAGIAVNGHKIQLGRFSTPEEAYEAYCVAARELHGQFANFAGDEE